MPGFDVHHIKSFGSDPRNDTLENLICLCRKHHQMAEARVISELTLQIALYQFYGYGVDPDLAHALGKLSEMGRAEGLTARFRGLDDFVRVEFVGAVTRFEMSVRTDIQLLSEHSVLWKELEDAFRRELYRRRPDEHGAGASARNRPAVHFCLPDPGDQVRTGSAE